MLGDIYIGRVQNIVKNIGAAFVEVEKGVLCYFPLEEAKHAIFTNKIGKKPLCMGDELLVQISKEAVKTKAPTVSSEISFTGKYVVLTHGRTTIGVSTKLPKELREEWKVRLRPYQNEQFGIVVRTNAKDVPVEVVLQELEKLKEQFFALLEKSKTRTYFTRLNQVPKSYLTALNNTYLEGFQEIVIEGHALYEEVVRFYEQQGEANHPALVEYTDTNWTLAKCYRTEHALSKALSERVWLKNGAYLVIQYTEALTVIDVNSGKCVNKKDPALAHEKINLEAAKEVAKQLRLRNLSGMIIVDFINLKDPEATKRLLHTFRQYLDRDPIQTVLVDMTKLQFVEVTRKKVRRPLHETIATKEKESN
jgi:ribonuclease G